MGSAATKGNHGQRKILQRFDPFDPSVGLPYEDGSLSYAGQHASQYQPGPTANGSASSDDLRAFKLAFADSSGNIEEFRMLPAELNMTLDGIKEKLESLFKSRLQGSGLLTGFRDTDGDFVTLKTEAEFRLFIEKQDEQTPMRLEVRREQTEPVLSSSHSAEARDAKRGRRRGATFAAGVRRGSQLQGKKKARAKESKSLTYRGTSDRNVDESISAGRAMSATCPALNEDDETSSGESSSHSTSSSGSIDPDSANEFAKQKETVRHLKLNDDSYSVDRGAAGKNERRTSHGKAAKPLKENGFGAHSPIAVSLDETTFTDETCLAEVPSTKKCHKAAKLHKHLRESKAIRWKRGKLLGRGAFGQVHLAMNIMTGRLMAVKRISIEESHCEEQICSLDREISLLRGVSHPRVVRYLGLSMERDENGAHVDIFLEYVSGGSISQALSQFGVFTEAVVRRFTYEIQEGLAFLHSRNIVHRDVKGANILLTDQGEVKLSDFGASKCLNELSCVTSHVKGTVRWMAPEIIRGKVTTKADIWSLGCTVIEMTTGCTPWCDFTNNMAAFVAIGFTQKPPEVPDFLSDECKSYLLECFAIDPDARPSATDLFSHPFHATHDDNESVPASLLPLDYQDSFVFSDLAQTDYDSNASPKHIASPSKRDKSRARLSKGDTTDNNILSSRRTSETKAL